MEADADEKVETGDTPLHIAAAGNKAAEVDALLKGGTAVDVLNLSGQTPLMLAAKHNHGDLVQKLLAAGADLHKPDENGDAAIHTAVEYGCMAAAAVLIAAGANVVDTNGMGQTLDELVPRKKKSELSKLVSAAKKKKK